MEVGGYQAAIQFDPDSNSESASQAETEWSHRNVSR